MGGIYALPDGRHIAIGVGASLDQLASAGADLSLYDSTAVLGPMDLSEHCLKIEEELAGAQVWNGSLREELEQARAELDRLTAETWTSPAGEVYDLRRTYRDAAGGAWTPIGWLCHFDAVPMPYLECNGLAADIGTVIDEYGPITPDPDDVQEDA